MIYKLVPSKKKRKNMMKESSGEETESNQETKKPTNPAELLKIQSEHYWNIRDNLTSNLQMSSRERKAICLDIMRYNGYEIDRFTAEEVLNAMADAMAFGRTEICAECGKSRVIHDGQGKYGL